MFNPSRSGGDSGVLFAPARTLPIRLEPLAEESLDSWLEALGRRADAAWGDVLAAVGLTGPVDGSAGVPRRVQHPLALTPEQLASLSHATGVSTERLRSLTLLSLLPTAWHDGSFANGLRLPGSRYCPVCLSEREGRWRLWWRLRWAFACPIHCCLLADECPACGRLQRVEPLPRDLVPDPALCSRRSITAAGRNTRRCQTRLADTSVIDLGIEHPAVRLQRRILDVVNAAAASGGIYTGSPVSGQRFLRDLSALGQRVLRYAQPADLETRLPADLWQLYERRIASHVSSPSPSPPWALTRSTTAITAAVAACVTMPILDSDTVALGGDQLRWLMSSMRDRGRAVSASNIGWSREVSAPVIGVQLSSIAPFLGPIDQLRYRCAAVQPRRPRKSTNAHRFVPALLWPEWALPLGGGGVGVQQLQSALSVTIVVTGSRIPVPTACALLGSVTNAPAVSRVLQMLYARADWSVLAETLIDLADQLDASPGPIDYHRRRAIPYAHLLPHSQWRTICRDTATPVGRAVKARLHRCWLYQRITGSPARRCPHAVQSRVFAAALADLPRTLSPELVRALDESARELLTVHGLEHEPLQWHPPNDLLTPTAPASADWTEDRLAQLHRLISVEALSLSEAARQMSSSIDGVRHVLNSHPAPRHLTTTEWRASGGVSARARGALSREQFVELYEDRGVSLGEIAEMIGVSRHTVTELAHDYGIALRSNRHR